MSINYLGNIGSYLDCIGSQGLCRGSAVSLQKGTWEHVFFFLFAVWSFLLLGRLKKSHADR